MVSGANSAEGGREGLGVMTLKKKKKGIEIVMSLSSTEAPAGYPISNGNRTEWSPIRSVIIRVINKIAVVRFV